MLIISKIEIIKHNYGKKRQNNNLLLNLKGYLAIIQRWDVKTIIIKILNYKQINKLWM